MADLDREFFARDTVTVARELIGTTLVAGRCAGRIVETEAYTTDAASHAVTRSRQAAIMRETFGHIYVYLIYGMYYCLNVTSERQGTGAVLIRAVEPTRGIDLMSERRGTTNLRQLASGPGRLCAAFGIDLKMNGSRSDATCASWHARSSQRFQPARASASRAPLSLIGAFMRRTILSSAASRKGRVLERTRHDG